MSNVPTGSKGQAVYWVDGIGWLYPRPRFFPGHARAVYADADGIWWCSCGVSLGPTTQAQSKVLYRDHLNDLWLTGEWFWGRMDCGEGCWIWPGRSTIEGYGQASVYGRRRLAHQVAWELTNGPIPEGLHMDHLCRVRKCARPDHLEPVTPLENQRRGMCGVLRTHCTAGHELTPENCLKGQQGRICRICTRARERERRRLARGAA